MFSLCCPLTLSRMRVAARGLKCRHQSCFDLETFLTSCRITGVWNCPVCNHRLSFNELRTCNWTQRAICTYPTTTTTLRVAADRTILTPLQPLAPHLKPSTVALVPSSTKEKRKSCVPVDLSDRVDLSNPSLPTDLDQVPIIDAEPVEADCRSSVKRTKRTASVAVVSVAHSESSSKPNVAERKSPDAPPHILVPRVGADAVAAANLILPNMSVSYLRHPPVMAIVSLPPSPSPPQPPLSTLQFVRLPPRAICISISNPLFSTFSPPDH